MTATLDRNQSLARYLKPEVIARQRNATEKLASARSEEARLLAQQALIDGLAEEPSRLKEPLRTVFAIAAEHTPGVVAEAQIAASEAARRRDEAREALLRHEGARTGSAVWTARNDAYRAREIAQALSQERTTLRLSAGNRAARAERGIADTGAQLAALRAQVDLDRPALADLEQKLAAADAEAERTGAALAAMEERITSLRRLAMTSDDPAEAEAAASEYIAAFRVVLQ